MTLAITEPVAEINITTNAGSYAFGAFTPVANSVLVVMAFVTGTVAAGTCTSVPALTWTQQQVQLYNSVDTAYLYTAVVGGSPSSTVVTINVTGDNGTGCHAVIFQVTGADYSGTPVRQTAKAAAATANPVVTFGSALLTGNGYCAAFGIPRSPPASTPPANWSEISDAGYSLPTAGGSGAYRVNGETGTTVTFTSAAGNYGILGCEINVGPSVTPLAVAGTMGSVSGTLGKATAKALAGVAGTLTGAVAKTTSKAFAGTAGALSGVLVNAKKTILAVAGTMGTMTGTLAKNILKQLSGTAGSLSGALTKSTARGLSGTVGALSGSISKSTIKPFAGVMGALTGSLNRLPTFVLSLSGAAGVLSGLVSKMTSKSYSGQAGALTGGLGKSTGKQVAGTVGSVSGSLGISFTAIKGLLGTVSTLLGSLSNQFEAGSTAIKLAVSGVITDITGNLQIWGLSLTDHVKAIWKLLRIVK